MIGFGTDQEPAILALGRPDAVLNCKGPSSAACLLERRHCCRTVLRVNMVRRNFGCGGRLEWHAGVARPLLVEGLAATLARGDPPHLRHRVGHKPEPGLAFP